MKLKRIFTAGEDNDDVLSMQTMGKDRRAAYTLQSSLDQFITLSSLKHRMLDKVMKYT